MPTVDEFWQVAGQVGSERGGLVVGFSEDALQPELGSTLDNVLGFQPRSSPTIVSLANWTDWKEQVEAFYRLRPSWGRGKVGDPNAKYYRVKFQEQDGSGLDSLSNTTADPPFSNHLSTPSFGGYTEPTGSLQGATFWPRTLARFIDLVVHYLISFVAGFGFVLLLAIAAGGRPPLLILQRISRIGFPTFVAGLLGWLAYHVICTSVYGSTVGKLVLWLQVVQDDGRPCPPKSAMIRELGFLVDALFFGIIGYMSMQGDPQQKRHGDDWAHTVVCKRSDVPEQNRQGAMRFVLGLMLGVFVDIAFLMVGLLVQMNS